MKFSLKCINPEEVKTSKRYREDSLPLPKTGGGLGAAGDGGGFTGGTGE